MLSFDLILSLTSSKFQLAITVTVLVGNQRRQDSVVVKRLWHLDTDGEDNAVTDYRWRCSVV